MRLTGHNSRRRKHYRKRHQQEGMLKRLIFGSVALTLSMTILAATNYWSGKISYASSAKSTANEVIKESRQLHGVLIDSSDPVTTSQKQQIENLLKFRFMKPVKKHDQIAVALLTHELFNPVEWKFTAVDPGKGSEVNPLFETPAMADQKREKTFLSSYYQAVGTAQMPIDRPKTPLIAGLNTISRHQTFRGGYGDSNTFSKRRFLLVTDGLENAEISAYKKTLYGKRGNQYVSQNLADLKGVEVTVALINRPKYRHLQNERHWNWLQGYLQRCGASSVRRIDIM